MHYAKFLRCKHYSPVSCTVFAHIHKDIDMACQKTVQHLDVSIANNPHVTHHHTLFASF